MASAAPAPPAPPAAAAAAAAAAASGSNVCLFMGEGASVPAGLSEVPGLALQQATTLPKILALAKACSGQGPAMLVAKLGKGSSAAGLDCVKQVNALYPSCFAIVFSHTAQANAGVRINCFKHGANMVSNVAADVVAVATTIAKQGSRGGKLQCPSCKLQHLTEDELWTHFPLYHVYDANITAKCPVCHKTKDNFAVHIREHGPAARGEVHSESRPRIQLYAFSLTVVRRPSDGKFLVTQEFAQSGYWLPGGGVDAQESLRAAAIRECKEEAGVDIKLTGVLQFQFGNWEGIAKLRTIFMAEPIDESKPSKTIPDFESAGSAWVTAEEILHLPVRGNEPRKWFKHVAEGGPVSPLSVLADL